MGRMHNELLSQNNNSIGNAIYRGWSGGGTTLRPSRSFARTDTHRYNMCVFVHSCCYNKIPQSGQLVINSSLFLTVLEAGSPRSAWSAARSAEGPLLGADFLRCLHMPEEARELFRALFIKA